MQEKFLARIAAIATVGAIVSACQYSPDIVDRTIAYNRAVATSTNQLLLLNIVRNAQRLPIYYTRLEANSASSGITPSFSLAQPFGRAHTFEKDIAPGGALSTKDTAALAAIASVLGLQSTQSNLLNLQTLDDQKYQQGMMQPLSLKIFKIFFDEGYAPDLLMNLFVSQIRIRKALIGDLDASSAERCQAFDLAETPGTPQQVCRFLAAKRELDGSPALIRAGDARQVSSLGSCVAGDAGPTDMVSFISDPAHEIDASGASHHTQACFERLVLDLLILKLAVTQQAGETYKFIDGPVADPLAHDAHFRAQTLQQGFVILPAINTSDSRKDPAHWVVCQKESGGGGFTLNVPSGREPDASKADRSALSELARKLTKPDKPTRTDSYQRTCAIVPEATTDFESHSDTIMLSSKKIEFTIRSFESMMYFLGEIARTDDTDTPVLIPVLGRNPQITQSKNSGDAAYWDTLFYTSKSLAGDDAAISVSDDAGASYSLPKPCLAHSAPALSAGRTVPCTSEYPDNESLIVLNLINQVWGLQKELASAPAAAVVVTP